MLTIPQDIPDFVLSSQLDNFTISADKQVDFVLKQGDTVILQENYTPDASNQIRILDMFSLMEPYLIASPLLQFSYTVSASGETSISKTFTVLLCRSAVPCSAEDFVNGYFLTTLAGRNKVTSFGRTETLYFVNGLLTEEEATTGVAAECVFVNDDNRLLKRIVPLSIVTKYGIYSVDVSPSRFNLSGYHLLRYAVMAASRKQIFHVDQSEPEAIGLKFRNSFGLVETFYFIGGDTVEPELTRSASYFSGQYKTYYVDEQRKHTLNTGYIPESMFALADDLARTTEAWLMDDSGDIPITIIESDTSRSDEDDGLFSFTVTYILASRCQQRIHLLPEVFDDSFDDTYN